MSGVDARTEGRAVIAKSVIARAMFEVVSMV